MSKTPSLEMLKAQLYIEENTLQPEESGLDDILKDMKNIGSHLPKDKTEAWMRHPPAHVAKHMYEPVEGGFDLGIVLLFLQMLLPTFIFIFLLHLAGSM